MMNGTVEQVVKHSFLYSYLLSQPFATYVDAYPMFQNDILLEAEAEQLEYGKHNEIVRLLQHKLNKLSYYDDTMDGHYGILTEHALKKFQSDHEIEITGQTDKETLETIIEEEKQEQLKKLDRLSESVYPGVYGEDVKIVQEALQYFGYYKGNLDGIYGPLTENALQIAEEEHGIQLADEVTQESLETLYQETEEVEVEIEEPEPEPEPKKEPIQAEEQVKEKEEVNEDQQTIKKVESESMNHTGTVEVARSFLGTPYVWGGESPSGFDCSGFIQYVFQMQDIIIPRTVSDTWNFTQPVDSPSVGDLVFFETYKPGPSHMGIYLGDGKFIHAGESRGVEISELDNSYWQPRYLGAKRIK